MSAAIRRTAAALLACGLICGCGGPVSDTEAIAAVAMTEVARTAAGQSLCVSREVGRWQPAAASRRIDPPAPPGFASLYATNEQEGGARLQGTAIGGVPIAAGAGCLELRGPLLHGDRAMIEVHLPGVGLNMWQRRSQGRWQLVTTTTSVYPS